MNAIEQSNYPVWAAIAAVRIERNTLTMCALYDALTFRRNARVESPQWFKEAWRNEVDRDLRAYGRVERTPHELAESVKKYAP